MDPWPQGGAVMKEIEEQAKKMLVAPPETMSEKEAVAYAFGWYKALEVHRLTIDESAAKRIATALGWAPKSEWVGLTTEDIAACDEESRLPAYEITTGDLQNFAYAIEAKLKEKNT
jgi:hypothetical protein